MCWSWLTSSGALPVVVSDTIPSEPVSTHLFQSLILLFSGWALTMMICMISSRSTVLGLSILISRKTTIQYVLTNSGGELNRLLQIGDKIQFRDWYKLAVNINKIKQQDNYSLPWNEIDVGISNRFLKSEYEKVKNAEVTPWCEEEGCYNCGACN